MTNHHSEEASKEAASCREVISRADLQEIFLARLVAGDDYVTEEMNRFRMVDMWLDALRPNPIYKKRK